MTQAHAVLRKRRRILSQPRDWAFGREGLRELTGRGDATATVAEAGGEGDDPLRFQAGVLGITAIARLAEAAASDEHGIAFPEGGIGGGHDVPGHINAAHQRKLAQDLAFARAGERVLVVDRRVRGLDDHFAGVERIERQRLDAAAIAGGVVVDAEGVEGRHGADSQWGGQIGTGLGSREDFMPRP